MNSCVRTKRITSCAGWFLGALLVGQLMVGSTEAAPVLASGAPELPVSQERLAELVEQLGSDKYAERRLAEKQLLLIGTDAFDILQQALDHDDLEIAARAQYLIGKITIRWTRPGDSRASRLLLREYAVSSAGQREKLISRLANLPNDEGLEGLCRVARFEKSTDLSSEAALLIMRGPQNHSAKRADRLEIIQHELGPSIRPAAKWLQAYRAMSEDAKNSVDRWDELFSIEKNRLGEDANHTILLAQLMYSVASAYQQQEEDEIAERIAAEALSLASDDADGHLMIAESLRNRGMMGWAEREYRHVLETAPAAQNTFTVYNPQEAAANSLSSMLYENGEEFEAAQVLESYYKTPNPNAVQLRSPMAQKEYYYAVHFGKKKDWDKQRQHLENALKFEPTHADVLIALHRFPEADEAFKRRTKELIVKADKVFQRNIANTPSSPTNYNQRAWLIGNTEGNIDEAIKWSHRSIALVRRNQDDGGRVAGFLDTLAHCYYAKKDFASAVKYQQQAVNLDPHSKLLSRQLAVFKKAMVDSKTGESDSESANP